MSSPTSRFSETAFRTYERYIAGAIAAYPGAINISPADQKVFGKSAETIRGRSKDALMGWIKCNYPTSQIDMVKWQTIVEKAGTPILAYDELPCRILIEPDGAHVRFGKDQQGTPPSPFFAPPMTGYDFIFDLSLYTPERLIFDLCNRGFIPSGVKVKGLSPQFITEYSESGDVSFMEVATGVHLIK